MPYGKWENMGLVNAFQLQPKIKVEKILKFIKHKNLYIRNIISPIFLLFIYMFCIFVFKCPFPISPYIFDIRAYIYACIYIWMIRRSTTTMTEIHIIYYRGTSTYLEIRISVCRAWCIVFFGENIRGDV